jgi:hypothetical protein
MQARYDPIKLSHLLETMFETPVPLLAAIRIYASTMPVCASGVTTIYQAPARNDSIEAIRTRADCAAKPPSIGSITNVFVLVAASNC